MDLVAEYPFPIVNHSEALETAENMFSSTLIDNIHKS
jgi:hypothetical protein